MVALSLTFWGMARLFFKESTPFYIPSNSMLMFQFLHTLINTYYYVFLITVILVDVEWYLFVVSICIFLKTTGFPDGSDSKKSACNAGDLGLIPGSGKKWRVTYSSILAEKIPWTEEPSRLQSLGGKELDTTEQQSLSLSWLSKCTIVHFSTQTPPKLHSLGGGMLGRGFLGTGVKYQRKTFFLSVEREGWCRSVLSCVWPYATPWTVACQAPLSMGFSRQEYWSGLPFPLPGNILDPGIKLTPLVSPALAGRLFTTEPPGKPGAGRAVIQNV